MKIRALRLAEVGPFGAPIALEGLSGGLDVLTGPNETGKSTLFTALGMLLAERHTSAARAVAAMRPDAGGAPLIEADIEIDGRELRLRKRFLAQRTARLEDLRSGEIWHGADAEAMADQWLGSEGRRVLRSLLWVAQGSSFALPEKPDEALTVGLAGLIEREAALAAGTGDVRRLAAHVQERLGFYLTRTGKTKTGGALELALSRRDEIARRLETARAKLDAAEVRLARKSALVAERAEKAGPDAADASSARAAAARKAVLDADRAREQVRAAGERVAARQAAYDQARQAVERFTRSIAEAARIERLRLDGASRLQALICQRTEREAMAVSAAADVETVEAALKAARIDIEAAHAAALKAAAWSEAVEAERRLGEANVATAQIAQAEARLAINAASETRIEAIRRLTARLGALDAQIAAEAARASFALLPAAAGRVLIDGRPIADGERITIDRPLQLVIEGVGTITIEPGQSKATSPLAERDASQDKLAAMLAEVGAADADAAEALLADRRRCEADAAAARARFAAAAPKGIKPLENSLRDALARAGDAAQGAFVLEAADQGQLERHVRELEVAVAQRRDAAGKAERELAALAAATAGLDAQLADSVVRQAEIDTELPVPAARETREEELKGLMAAAGSALAEVVRERTAWADVAPTVEVYAALVAEDQRAAEALARQGAQRAALDREIAEFEGALNRDSEDGVGAEIARLEEELQAAQARVGDIETDVAALQMLTVRLGSVITNNREQVLRPVVDRLQPLLGRLFADARIAMEGPLLIARLERAERHDPLARVSGGTQEQIATLVRVAYADLMAARGVAMPLVLDDPLVFSDDQRLEVMVELLAAAALRHQVIVLSCHQRALDPLMAAHGACRLTLSPWLDSEANAISRASGGSTRRIANSNKNSSVSSSESTRRRHQVV